MMQRTLGAIILLELLVGRMHAEAEPPIWVQYYGPSTVDEAHRVVADGFGGIYIAGQSDNGSDINPFLAKYDVSGKQLWDRSDFGTVAEDSVRGLATDPFGNVYVAGGTKGSLGGGNEGGWDGFVAKFDTDGNQLWARQFGWDLNDGATGVAITAAGVYVCGYVSTPEEQSDLVVKRYSFTGNDLGSIQIGGSAGESAADIVADSLGDIYVAGTTSGDLFGVNAGSNDFFVAKFNPQGSTLWGKQYGTEKIDAAFRLDITHGDVLHVAGATRGSLYDVNHGLSDPFVMAIDSEIGQTLWARQPGSSEMEFGNGIHADYQNEVHLGVWSYVSGPSVYKLDPAHEVVETNATGSASRGIIRSVTGSGSGTVYVAGREGNNQSGEAFLASFFGDEKKVLVGVPEYKWNYGCTPAVAGMLMGYWDRQGFGKLVAGEQVLAPLSSHTEQRPRDFGPIYEKAPQGSSQEIIDSLIASEGHHRDYWAHGFGPDEGANNDPMLDHHKDDCLADYMGTSKGVRTNGATHANNEVAGLLQWAYDTGQFRLGEVYAVEDSVATFDKIKAEIDNSAPVMLSLACDGYLGGGHSVLAYGYLDLGPNDQWYAVRDTWMDGDSNGKFRIVSFVDQSGVEWWKFNFEIFFPEFDGKERIARVSSMTTFTPIGAYDLGDSDTYERSPKSLLRISDGFDRIREGQVIGDLSYNLLDSSADQSGQVLIESSPLDPANSVLRMTSATGDPLAIWQTVGVDPKMQLSFDYLFDDPGKLDIYLGDTLLYGLDSPTIGPGSPGSGQFATYREYFDLLDMSFSPWSQHDLRFVLSASDDPTLFLDNLLLMGIPSMEPVPEPSALILLAIACTGYLACTRRRQRRFASPSK
jgi:beta-propeller repeat-containing protein